MAEFAILNVGTGDTKISFDPDDPPEEKIKAGKLVKDALRRGYAVLVEVGKDDKGPIYRRAVDFDESTHEYIIAGVPPELETEEQESQEEKPRRATAKRKNSAGGRKQTSRVSASKRGAIAVSRTAGG